MIRKKNGMIAAAFLIVLLGCFLPWTGTAASVSETKAPHHQTLTYKVYVGGLYAGKAELNLTYDSKNHYIFQLNASTKGFLNTVLPWTGLYEAKGQHLKNGQNRPLIFQSFTTRKKKKESVIFDFSKNNFRLIKGQNISEQKIDKSLTKGMTDVLTAALKVMEKANQTGVCEGYSDVFDGRRRFYLILNPDSAESLESSAYNIYQGQAARCTIEIKPIEGTWHKQPKNLLAMQEQGRKYGTPPTVWIAKVSPPGPAVPVKVLTVSDYGTILIHLAGYKENGKDMNMNTMAWAK